jgi:hypothetical protein
MIAITMLGIGILSLGGPFPAAMKSVSTGDLESRAVLHAESEIEELRALPWDDLTAIASVDSVETIFQRGWLVLEDTPSDGMKQVQVVVSWTDNEGPRNVTVSSYLSNSGT